MLEAFAWGCLLNVLTIQVVTPCRLQACMRTFWHAAAAEDTTATAAHGKQCTMHTYIGLSDCGGLLMHC